VSKGIFTDKHSKPTDEQINQSLGDSLSLWNELLRFIEVNFRTTRQFKFYGKNYGWALNFKKSGKSFVSLYPSENAFTAQIILKEGQIHAIPDHAITAKLKKAIESATPYAEGRWLFLPVETQADLDTIQQLLLVKAQ
jgi:hypothetical protein